jgi:hypothetical protein
MLRRLALMVALPAKQAVLPHLKPPSRLPWAPRVLRVHAQASSKLEMEQAGRYSLSVVCRHLPPLHVPASQRCLPVLRHKTSLQAIAGGATRCFRYISEPTLTPRCCCYPGPCRRLWAAGPRG